MRADPHCSALVLPEPAERGRLVSLLLAGEVTCPQGRSRLSAPTSYIARMRSLLPSVSSSMRGLLDKKVFVLEAETIELVDTLLCGGTVRVGRGPRGWSAGLGMVLGLGNDIHPQAPKPIPINGIGQQ